MSVITKEERELVIEECAAHLETIANQFLELANESDDAGSVAGAMSLADSYHMAANEVRRLIPSHVSKEERNQKRVKEWMQAINRFNEDGTQSLLPPDLESYGPTKH